MTQPTTAKKSVQLSGVVVAESAVSSIDPDAGVLMYRGYDIADLAEHASYEEVAYLLLEGELPDGDELEGFRDELAARELPPATAAIVDGRSLDAAPMEMLRTAVSSLSFSDPAEAAIDRSVQMIRAIPFLAALPLVIVWLGVGEAEKIFLVALGVTFPIYINTTLGIRQVDPKLLELGRVQGLSTLELIRRIILPGALPSILTGVRYALATAWLALVVAETIGAQSGIGFLAMDAREFLRTDVIVLTIVIYALIGVAADGIARFLERRLLAWHPNYGAPR